MIQPKSARQLVQDLNLADEQDDLEAKTISENELGKSVYETISALQNEPGLGGGTILLGVKKEDALFPLYSATGIGDPEKVSTDLASACRTKFNNPVSPKIRTETVDGVNVVRVDVPEASKSSKPVYIKSSGLPGGAFRRISSRMSSVASMTWRACFRGSQSNSMIKQR